MLNKKGPKTTARAVKIGPDHVFVSQIAHGLMMLTWTANPVPHEQAFEAIKAGIDSLPAGVKMLLNTAEFYDPKGSPANLDLLAAFFEKYPQYVDRTFLSVKGGLVENGFEPDLSPENIRRSVDRINEHLRGTKKLDLFEPARMDPKVPIEDVMKTLAALVKEEKFTYIGLSECSADTLKRAVKVHPVAAVEIEVSPWSYEEETKNVIAAAKQLGVSVVAYAPLGRGFLTGQIKSRADIPEGDMRLQFTRFSEENIKKNLKIVDELKAIAEKKKITAAQLSLAWVGSLGSHVIVVPGSSKKERVLENMAAGQITLTKKEIAAINKVLADNVVSGDRYFGDAVDAHLWG